MPPRKRREARAIVSAQKTAITVLSSPLVLRGLREFAHTSRWTVRKAFAEPRLCVSISSLGYAAAISREEAGAGHQLEISDLELSGPATVISVPEKASVANSLPVVAFGWSPSEKIIVATSEAWQPELYLFDLRAKNDPGRFGAYRIAPGHLCWSAREKYFAASSEGSEDGTLQLWKAGRAPAEFKLLREAGASSFEDDSEKEDLGDQGRFFGFGGIAFHPDEKSLATVLEFDGDWSDDSILLASIPTLGPISRFEAIGRVTDLSWSADGSQLFFCASGQVYTLDAKSNNITSLPFSAEQCHCHPSQPLCAFYNSWLKNAAEGRIFVVDLQQMNVMDECRAEGILSLRWSRDGHTLYAVAQDGTAYLYERPLP
jgi:WD40 repeat protein